MNTPSLNTTSPGAAPSGAAPIPNAIAAAEGNLRKPAVRGN